MFSFFLDDNICLSDSHIHLLEVSNFCDDFYETLLKQNPNLKIKLCSCAHFPYEYEKQSQIVQNLNLLNDFSDLTNDLTDNSAENFSDSSQKLKGNSARNLLPKSSAKIKIFCAYGLHPQNKNLLSEENLKFFEDLLKKNKLDAIGECGFDLFSNEFKENFCEQKKAFEICIEFSKKYNLPLIIHNRKGIQEIFKYLGELKKIKAIVFHSFSYGSNEANYILKNGVNAFFSYGKTLLLNSKKYENSFKTLPLDRILLETDAPFMRSKNQKFTSPIEILDVYKKACNLLEKNPQDLCKIVSENFDKVFDFKFP